MSPVEEFAGILQAYVETLALAVPKGSLERLVRYYRFLHQEGSLWNLTRRLAPREAVVWHILDTLLPLHSGLHLGAPLLDLGSGAGIPGLVIAALYPDWEITLLEVTGKKARFLTEAAVQMGLRRVTVLKERAEIAGHGPHRARYQSVTARAVAALPVLLEWSMPFLAPNGTLLAWKGPELSQEERGSGEIAAQILHASWEESVSYHLPEGAGERQVIRFTLHGEISEKYPRSPSQVKNKPLGR